MKRPIIIALLLLIALSAAPACAVKHKRTSAISAQQAANIILYEHTLCYRPVSKIKQAILIEAKSSGKVYGKKIYRMRLSLEREI